VTPDKALQTLLDLETFLHIQWVNTNDPERLAIIEKLSLQVSEIKERSLR
jgi:hypothetical protein